MRWKKKLGEVGEKIGGVGGREVRLGGGGSDVCIFVVHKMYTHGIPHTP